MAPKRPLLFQLSFVLIALALTTVNSQILPPSILFGQSCVLSGPNAFLGTRMNAGIMAAFQQVNAVGGIRGSTLTLKVYDDGYNPAPAAANTATLIYNDTVFALLGYVGTPTSVAALPVATAAQFPFVGALTGTGSLRNPYSALAVNVRASYTDEAAAWANLLVGYYRLKRIACFYQNDSFGLSGLTGISNMLAALDMKLVAQGLYTRNTVDVAAGLASINAVGNTVGGIEAVVLVGTFGAVANFIIQARNSSGFKSDCRFVVVSFAGAEALRDALGTPDQWANVFMTQVVPFPHDTSYLLVRNYQAAMLAYAGPSAAFEFNSLEGYLVGRFAAEVVSRLTAFSRAEFVRVVQSTSYFLIDDIELGLYVGACPANAKGTQQLLCNCNQGMRRVWTSQINQSTGVFEEVPNTDFQFPLTSCQSKPTQLKQSIAFGTLGPATGPAAAVATWHQQGIAAAFSGVNSRGGAANLNLQLVVGSSADRSNISAFIANSTVAGLIGGLTAPNALPPFVPSFGEQYETMSDAALDFASSPSRVLTTASLEDEVFALVSYAYANGLMPLRAVVVLSGTAYQRAVRVLADSVDLVSNGQTALSQVVQIANEYTATDGSVVIITDNVDDVWTVLSSATSTTKVLLPMRTFVMAQAKYPTINASSRVAFVTSLMDINRESSRFAQDFHSDVPSGLQSNLLVQEGYVLGRFMATLVTQNQNRSATVADMLRQLFTTTLVTVGTAEYGPYLAPTCGTQTCGCSNGIRNLYILNATNALQQAVVKQGCKVQYRVVRTSGLNVVIPVLATILPALLLGLAVALYFLYRSSQRDNSMAPQDSSLPFTVCFTDIESSTLLWARHPELMGDAIDAHHEIIRGLIQKHNLYEVKTIGDSFMIAAKEPRDMLRFALELQCVLFEHSWHADAIDATYRETQGAFVQSLVLSAEGVGGTKDHGGVSEYRAVWNGLRVRIGIHIGHGEIRKDPVTKGFDYYGSVTNCAARVEAAAHGGQIVFTQEFLDAAGSTGDCDAVVTPLGPQTLRGLEQPVSLYQVLPSQLAGRVFPELRTNIDIDIDDPETKSSLSRSAASSYVSQRPSDGLLESCTASHSLVASGAIPRVEVRFLIQRIHETLCDFFAVFRGANRATMLKSACKSWRLKYPAQAEKNDDAMHSILMLLAARLSETARSHAALHQQLENHLERANSVVLGFPSTAGPPQDPVFGGVSHSEASASVTETTSRE